MGQLRVTLLLYQQIAVKSNMPTESKGIILRYPKRGFYCTRKIISSLNCPLT
jgi:hypothetical protein